jgi:ComF family protein
MIVQNNICRGFLDALFPPLCLLCGEMSRGPHPHCCPECLAAFEPIGNSCCPLCGEPFPVRQHPHLCLRCRVRSRRPVPCRSLYMYRGAAARALSLLKYEKRLCILQPLTEAMLLAVGEPVRYSEVDLLIPVPVTRRGLWKRGFNQSAVLADSLGRYLEVPVERSALRRYGSHPQVGLGRRDRYRNAAESFGPGRCIDRVKGRRILIFDDVYTTGATVMTCAKILRNQGALVSILTFARTAPENIEHLVVDRSVRG